MATNIPKNSQYLDCNFNDFKRRRRIVVLGWSCGIAVDISWLIFFVVENNGEHGYNLSESNVYWF